jgi:hypothetical protein
MEKGQKSEENYKKAFFPQERGRLGNEDFSAGILPLEKWGNHRG